jgi:uncharacterized protein YfaS (alpha-2-macroglobulin family)
MESTLPLQKKPFTAEVFLSEGSPLAKISEKEEIALPLDAVSHDLILRLKGEGPLYYGLSLSGVPEAAVEAYNKGIEVRRVVNSSASLGQKLSVELYVTPLAPTTTLVLSDLLPGGLEIESTGEIYYMPADGGEIRAEKRDDRLILFITNLKGPLIYRYTTRAVTRGTFALPPVSVEDMYNPGIRSLSHGGTLTIE